MSIDVQATQRWQNNGVTTTSPVDDAIAFACPQCGARLERRGADEFVCPLDQRVYERSAGIWRLINPERSAYFAEFIRDYETVRREEGRGSDDPAYYRTLPYADTSGHFAEDWRIRATSFRALMQRIVEPRERELARPLTILDLGAGNGWLSNRLAERGHHVVAVDLLTNDRDGLGAHVHYLTDFTPVQAEFDHLPFTAGQFDLAIFNGSLHYSTNIQATLAEALRVVKADGEVAIVDSPVYRDPASGAAMVREREEEFQSRYGFPSNALPSENYLTFDRVRELGQALGLQWRLIQPYYGLSWALRPLKARVRRRREPARFLLIVGRRAQPHAHQQRRLMAAASRRWLTLRYKLTQRHRYDNLVLEDVDGIPILVLPQVFNPKLLRTGAFLAGALNERVIPAGASVLDMGTGSGIGAIAAAPFAGRVVAVDINPQAVRCARINTLLNEVEESVDVRQGDLFESVQGERFDVVLFNPPYYRGVPEDQLDHAWRSVDVIERFAAGLRDHLTPHGVALVILSTDGEAGAFLDALGANGFRYEILTRKNLINETLTIYQLSSKE